MISAKQRSYLKSLANPMKPLVHIGKEGITDAVLEQIDEILKAHEIVKVAILETADLDPREAAIEVCEKVRAEFVQAIGRRFTVYKKNHDNPKIDLSQRGIFTKNAIISKATLGTHGLTELKKKSGKAPSAKGAGKGTRSGSKINSRGNSRGK